MCSSDLHAMKAGGKVKQLTDPRDIYEYVANQSQRRVRTCLENIIPRDIVEVACQECNETLKAEIKNVEISAKKMLVAFSEFSVTQAMVEARIQRHMAAITPGQIIGLRKIYVSIKDGMSEPGDWFDMSNATAGEKMTAAEKAKAAMREKSAPAAGGAEPKAAPKVDPKPTPPADSDPPPSPPAAPAAEEQQRIRAAAEQVCEEIGQTDDPGKVKSLSDAFAAREDINDPGKRLVCATAVARIEELESKPQKSEADPAPTEESPDYAEQVAQWLVDLDVVETIRGLKQALAAIPTVWPEDAQEMIRTAIKEKIDALRGEKEGE